MGNIKRKRDVYGRFTRDYTLYKAFLVSVGIGVVLAMAFVAIHRVLAMTNEFEVSKSYEMTWREKVMWTLDKSGVDRYKAERIIMCESSWNPDAVNYNKKGLGVDRGLWQINSVFHPEVSQDCAYDPICSTKASIKIVKKKGFSEWSCNKLLK